MKSRIRSPRPLGSGPSVSDRFNGHDLDSEPRDRAEPTPQMADDDLSIPPSLGMAPESSQNLMIESPPSVKPEPEIKNEVSPAASSAPEPVALMEVSPIEGLKPSPSRKTSRASAPAKTPKPDHIPDNGSSGLMHMAAQGGALYWSTALLIALMWVGGIMAIGLGAENGLNALMQAPYRAALMAMMAILPVGLLFASAFALTHAARLSHQAARTAALAEAMVAPTAAASRQASDLITGLQAQLTETLAAVRAAQDEVMEMSQRLSGETRKIDETSQTARSAASHIAEALGHERVQLSGMTDRLNQQANHVIAAVDTQARMVAEASDLAQTQLREAEAALAARAADLMAAAADVQQSGQAIADDLGHQTEKLETAGFGVANQIRAVEEGLSQQRAGLVSAALSLRADQEDFAVHLESQRTQLTDALSVTRRATVDLGETSSRGIELLRSIIQTAQDQFGAIFETAEHERATFETRVQHSLAQLSHLAADARDDVVRETGRAVESLNTAATESRRAADLAAQSAQARVDSLNESLFEVGKRADDVFDNRFNTARRLIEDSALLIHEAGDRTAERLDQSFDAARQSIVEVDQALQALNESAARLPAFAKSHIQDITHSVEGAIAAMRDAARKAAQETEAVDSAFQERVKRNYDMLSEAVHMMGVISGGQPLHATHAAASRPQARAMDASASMPRPLRDSRPPEISRGPAYRQAPSSTEAPQAQPESEGGFWRGLLGTMDGARADTPTRTAPSSKSDAHVESLDDLIIGEISGLGIDAQTLLNTERLNAAIKAMLSDDQDAARLVVRRTAPAAIRRLGRRMSGDARLKDQACDFIAYYDRMIHQALMTKNAESALGSILDSDTGRAFLLSDAALHDLI